MNIKPMHPNFKLPTKATSGSGAYDLYMPEAGVYEEYSEEGTKVSLGFAAEVPEGHVALLLPRSSVGFKHGVELANTCGVIDSDFRGEWKAKIQTKIGRAYGWEAGDRVLQVLFVPVRHVVFDVVDELETTERNEGGFGSTGQ